jgi:hypothetical protein
VSVRQGRIVAALAGMALVVCPVAARAMSVGTFLAKAQALQDKGMFALGSSDIALLRDEVTNAANAYRADLAADAQAKRPARACPPPRNKTNVTSKDIIASFKAIPAAERGISVKVAFYRFMDKRFPCR